MCVSCELPPGIIVEVEGWDILKGDVPALEVGTPHVVDEVVEVVVCRTILNVHIEQHVRV